jgi:hypothetical protein
MFSADGAVLYGVRSKPDSNQLIAIDVATLKMRDIGDLGPENRPLSNLNPGVRMTLLEDGKSALISVNRSRTSLWMLTGFVPPRGIWPR